MPRLLLGFLCAALAFAEPPLLLQKPAVSRTQIVFSYAGDLWTVPRAGGEARQLTSAPGTETAPAFSPDGATIAFTGEYDGNVDIFTVPAVGGVPKRLTWHPGADTVLGWSPDGKRLLFRSQRDSYSRFGRLFTMPAEGGGLPEAVPLPMGEEGAWSPDGKLLAYVPLPRAFDAWKRYRGGRTTPLWIADPATSAVVAKVPRENSNDFSPVWAADGKVYFLSDRGGPVTIYAYDTRTKQVARVLANTGLDVKSMSGGPGVIVYEQFGSLNLLDLKSGKAQPVSVRIAADLPRVRPTFEKAAPAIQAARLSPTGARALVEARGEILTIPAEKGDPRNLTNTPGVAERDPAWSPDGRRIAYFSDESGEYALHLREQSGMGDVIKIALPQGFYYAPQWSPDSRKIAFTDQALNLWYIDLEKRAPVKVDTDTYDHPERDLGPVWAPDSRWLAYAKMMKNHLRAVFVYSIEDAKTHQVTDGMSDARYPQFDKNGEVLYFTASTDSGPTQGWLDMSSMGRFVSRSVYVVVLRKDLPSPLAPESDEEKIEDAGKAATEKPDDKDKEKDKKAVGPMRIDFDNIGQRILALPIPARNYGGLIAGKAGALFVEERPAVPGPGPYQAIIHKYDAKTRKTEKFLDGVRLFEVSANGEKMLFRKGEAWSVAGTAAVPKPGEPPKPGEGTLKMDALEVRVDPRAEWSQMYREVWRLERDFFYDPNLHGVNLKETQARYEPYLETLGSRQDLNYLFSEMLGELSVGHLYVAGGAMPDVKRVRGGLLGCDFKIENGRYRFARVYNGENWNPDLKAPLTQPGVNVGAGEYLLSVNGREVRATDNVYSFFEGTAGKSVLLRVGPDAGGANAREVTVVPVENEFGLRNLAWIEDNRRKVDQLSKGRLAYVYLPNTSTAGYSNFNRYYFAQTGREGAVIDERFNGGGAAADYIVDYMSRRVMNWFTTRYGDDFSTPTAGVFGPKAMIVNEFAGSGGDLMPWLFRKMKLGPLVGTRTCGGLVGIFGFPPLVDGGRVTAPDLAFFNLDGEWEIENHGVAPDIEVEMEPEAWHAGRDPQLEKAVELVMADLDKNPRPQVRKPAYPNYHKGR
jgi:tricorn protease